MLESLSENSIARVAAHAQGLKGCIFLAWTNDGKTYKCNVLTSSNTVLSLLRRVTPSNYL